LPYRHDVLTGSTFSGDNGPKPLVPRLKGSALSIKLVCPKVVSNERLRLAAACSIMAYNGSD
jgi:hypothetical protein